LNLVLARIDQRLIHGQVSVGWVPVLRADRILVADDALARDEWEREMLESAAPSGVEVDVFSLVDAARRLVEESESRVLVLVRSPSDMLRLVGEGAPLERVNVGGLHHRAGARPYLEYLYLTAEDIEALLELARAGIVLFAQDLPGNRSVELNPLLLEGELVFDRLPDRGS
jgi:mannose/fructose/N-acetylgalactosamine-specific phosphotransferase system component IIB